MFAILATKRGFAINFSCKRAMGTYLSQPGAVAAPARWQGRFLWLRQAFLKGINRKPELTAGMHPPSPESSILKTQNQTICIRQVRNASTRARGPSSPGRRQRREDDTTLAAFPRPEFRPVRPSHPQGQQSVLGLPIPS